MKTNYFKNNNLLVNSNMGKRPTPLILKYRTLFSNFNYF